MKRLHFYIIKSFLGPFAMTFAIAMIILLLNFVWKYIDELVGKGLEWIVIAELIAHVSLTLIPMAMILGILLASLMTFGNLGENNELIALKSSGVSLIRILYPVFIIVFSLGLFSLLFSNYALPVNNLKYYNLLRDIREQRPELDIPEGEFYNGLDDYSIMIGNRSKDGMTLYDLMIYDHTKKQGNISITLADSGYMRLSPDENHLILSLFNGSSNAEQLSDDNKIQENKPLRRDIFSQQEILIELKGSKFSRSKENKYGSHYLMLNMKQLRHTARDLHKEASRIKKELEKNLLESEFFLLENKKKVHTNKASYNQPPSSTDPATLIATLPLNMQGEVFFDAQNYARSVKTKLNSYNIEIENNKKWANRYWNEWNRMLSNAIACILFFLIGAPLGAIIRKGGLGTPVVVSVIFFIIYYMISIAGEKYARLAIIPSWAGMWLSTLFLIPISIFLIKKSNQDSQIMETETYILIFKKIIGKIGFGKIKDSE